MTITRTVQYSNDVWLYNSSACECMNGGSCVLGRCRCLIGYYGNKCEKQRCPGSFCFYDIDTRDSELCFHCSGHGDCETEGNCVC